MVDAAVKAQMIRASLVAGDSHGIELRALRLPSTTWSVDDKQVTEDVPLFLSQQNLKTEKYMKLKLAVLTVIAMTLGVVDLSASASTPGSPLGEVVPLSGAVRTIPIYAKTKYVNVTAHETVKFVATGNAFAIRFSDGSATASAFVPSAFDIEQLAPARALNHKVTVYVAPDPLYIP